MNIYTNEEKKTSNFLEYLNLIERYIKEMRDFGILFEEINYDILKKNITFYNEIRKEQLNAILKKYNKLLDNAENFSICVLFDEKQNIWLNKRINPKKDFYEYYQVAGGKLEPGETYQECAIREVKEESGIEIDKDKLIFICFDNYFSEYKKKIFNCEIIVYCIKKIIINYK